jgi:hypothetical protein
MGAETRKVCSRKHRKKIPGAIKLECGNKKVSEGNNEWPGAAFEEPS